MKLQINGALSYLLRLIKYIAANTPIIANNNSKPGIDVGVGDSVGLGEGEGEGISKVDKAIYSKGLPIQSSGLNSFG